MPPVSDFAGGEPAALRFPSERFIAATPAKIGGLACPLPQREAEALVTPAADLAASMKVRIRAGSFTPRALSTPEDTSTARAPVVRIAAATLSTVRPPASIHGAGAVQPR